MKIIEKKVDNVSFITLDNEMGLVLVLSSFAASIFDIEFIDKRNKLESVILTPSSLNDFYYNDGYYGKTIGRFSGRIDKGLLKINDAEYKLDINWNNVNSLHGGNDSISFKNFDYTIKEYKDYVDVTFSYLEKENILPGDVNYDIIYRVYNNANDFTIYFNAKTNKDTLVNLTNHTYFNLSGNGKRTILDHKLKLNCDRYTNLNNELITTSIDKVNKVMSFMKPHKIKKYINDDSLQNHTAKGYDHCYLKEDEFVEEIAILKDRKSKRSLTIKTSYPSIVVYTTNYPASFDFSTNRYKISKHHGICLECQYVPNGINMENVNKAILRKDETYYHYISYSFSNK